MCGNKFRNNVNKWSLQVFLIKFGFYCRKPFNCEYPILTPKWSNQKFPILTSKWSNQKFPILIPKWSNQKFPILTSKWSNQRFPILTSKWSNQKLPTHTSGYIKDTVFWLIVFQVKLQKLFSKIYVCKTGSATVRSYQF